MHRQRQLQSVTPIHSHSHLLFAFGRRLVGVLLSTLPTLSTSTQCHPPVDVAAHTHLPSRSEKMRLRAVLPRMTRVYVHRPRLAQQL